MTKTEKAISYMEKIATDNTHGYDQIHRWGVDFDCSSLVISAWENAGVPVKSKYGATYTGNMYKAFLAAGFEDVSRIVNFKTRAGLKRGDVLLNVIHHTAMYCGNGNEVEASANENGHATGGQTGDQTGKEILIRSYRDYPWNFCLRYSEPKKLKSTNTVAKEVIHGDWGNGQDRILALIAAGYDADEIQSAVNKLLKKG